MHVTTVVWNDENMADIAELGYSIVEIEDVLLNRHNPSRLTDELDGSLPLCVTVGTARTGRRIVIKCAFVCGNPLEVYPIAAYAG